MMVIDLCSRSGRVRFSVEGVVVCEQEIYALCVHCYHGPGHGVFYVVFRNFATNRVQRRLLAELGETVRSWISGSAARVFCGCRICP